MVTAAKTITSPDGSFFLVSISTSRARTSLPLIQVICARNLSPCTLKMSWFAYVLFSCLSADAGVIKVSHGPKIRLMSHADMRFLSLVWRRPHLLLFPGALWQTTTTLSTISVCHLNLIHKLIICPKHSVVLSAISPSQSVSLSLSPSLSLWIQPFWHSSHVSNLTGINMIYHQHDLSTCFPWDCSHVTAHWFLIPPVQFLGCIC